MSSRLFTETESSRLLLAFLTTNWPMRSTFPGTGWAIVFNYSTTDALGSLFSSQTYCYLLIFGQSDPNSNGSNRSLSQRAQQKNDGHQSYHVPVACASCSRGQKEHTEICTIS